MRGHDPFHGSGSERDDRKGERRPPPTLRLLPLLLLIVAPMAVSCADAARSVSTGPHAAQPGRSPLYGGEVDGPAAVGMIWRESDAWCSGTLITPQLVLTAGHCVRPDVMAFYTGIGVATPADSDDTSSRDAMERHEIDGWASSPEYVIEGCPKTSLDIGLVHLAVPITDIAPIPYSADTARLGECTTVGFGRHLEDDGTITSQQKRTADVLLNKIGTYAVEATSINGVPESGDSGGPLVCDGKIVGTVSCHTDGDWPDHKTEHYARVQRAAAWIAGKIERWESDG